MKGTYYLEVYREVSDKVLDNIFNFDSSDYGLMCNILWQNKQNWIAEGFFVDLYDPDGNVLYWSANGNEE